MKIYEMELDNNRLPVLVVQETVCEYSNENLNTTQKIVDLFTLGFGLDRKAEEFVYMIAFTAKMKPLGIFMIGKGTATSCLCSSREIFMRALAVGAVSIVVVHNHPSGDCSPSDSDMSLLKRLNEAGKIIGIELTDFIIVGQGVHFSASDLDFL